MSKNANLNISTFKQASIQMSIGLKKKYFKLHSKQCCSKCNENKLVLKYFFECPFNQGLTSFIKSIYSIPPLKLSFKGGFDILNCFLCLFMISSNFPLTKLFFLKCLVNLFSMNTNTNSC